MTAYALGRTSDSKSQRSFRDKADVNFSCRNIEP